LGDGVGDNIFAAVSLHGVQSRGPAEYSGGFGKGPQQEER